MLHIQAPSGNIGHVKKKYQSNKLLPIATGITEAVYTSALEDLIAGQYIFVI
ncbi:MAG: hypothetical protein WDO19_18685 [Bacteroidota bacterium]